MKQNLNICPICEIGVLQETFSTAPVTYQQHIAEVSLRYAICDYCHSEVASNDHIEMNRLMMINYKSYIDDFNNLQNMQNNYLHLR